MKKLRRKLTDRFGEQKTRTVWKCYCKIGTFNGTYAYFFEEPKEGLNMDCVELDIDPVTTMHKRSLHVLIDEVREDGMVFCSKH